MAWGALAFGAVYPWAMWPLAVAELGVGVVVCARRPPVRGEWPLVAALGAIAVGIALQLLPLGPGVVSAIAPSADRLLREHDLGYALVGRWHGLSIDPPSTLRALLLYVPLVALLVGLRRGLSRRSAERLASGLAVFASLLALIGVLQLLTYNGKVLWFWTPYSGGYRPFGPFINRNHFAGWMAMALPVAIGLLFARVSRAIADVAPTFRARLVWLFSNETSKTLVVALAVLVMAFSTALTLSRSGIAATATAMTLAVLFGMRPMRGGRRLMAAAGIALVAVAAAALAGPSLLAARFGEDWATNRLGIWKDTIVIARDFAPFGSGANTFATAALFYQDVLPYNSVTAAHNDYLQIASDGGFVIGLPALAAIAVVIIEVRRRLRASVGTAYWIRLGAATGLGAIALQSLADFSLQIPGNAALFAVLLALATYPDR